MEATIINHRIQILGEMIINQDKEMVNKTQKLMQEEQ